MTPPINNGPANDNATPAAPPARPITKPALAGVVAIAIMAAAAAPIAERWEGFAAKPYLDPAKIRTFCYGETDLAKLIANHVYDRTECGQLLRDRLAADYAPALLRCLPELKANAVRARFVGGALLDASYNAGPAAVCKSPMAAHVRAGRISAACEALPGWYVTARNRKTGQRIRLAGLVNRRNDERRHCMMGSAS